METNYTYPATMTPKQKHPMTSTSSAIVAYVIKNDVGAWYYCGIEYWIMTDWSQWGIDLSQDKTSVEDAFLNAIEEYRVEQADLKAKFEKMDDDPKAFFLLPMVVADFDKRQFFSNYYDRLLETMVLEEWTGSFENVLDKVPGNERYWIVSGENRAVPRSGL